MQFPKKGARRPAWDWIELARLASARLACGSAVKVVGPPLTTTGTLPLVSQPSTIAPACRLTGSEKVTDRLASSATDALPLAGEVAVTVGAASGTGKVWPALQVPKLLAEAAAQLKLA